MGKCLLGKLREEEGPASEPTDARLPAEPTYLNFLVFLFSPMPHSAWDRVEPDLVEQTLKIRVTNLPWFAVTSPVLAQKVPGPGDSVEPNGMVGKACPLLIPPWGP